MAGHAVEWPIARDGSQTIADALASYFVYLGGAVEVGVTVSSLGDVPRARAVLFDVTPRQLADIAGAALPPGYVERLRAHRYGSGVFKVDWALGGFRSRGKIPVAYRQARSTWAAHLKTLQPRSFRSGREGCRRDFSCSCRNPASSMRADHREDSTQPGRTGTFPMDVPLT
jgi:hypothetical protein